MTARYPTVRVKALTVWQPWAECLARGVKPVENRTRPFGYRGPLAIHAGRRRDHYAVRHPLVRAALADTAMHHLPTGVVVAVADLVDCHPGAGCCRPWGEPGTYHLVLAHVRRLARPIPARGERGLWHIHLADPAVLGLPEVAQPGRAGR